MNFQKIINIISDAFSIFDFSYIISGGLTFLVILFDLHYHQVFFTVQGSTTAFLCGIFLSYICGVLSWLCGKNIRRFFFDINKDFENTYDNAMLFIEHECKNNSTPVDDKSLEYERIWIWLCKEESAKDRVNFIHRFWVMQATYEGLIFSSIISIAVLIDLKVIDNGFMDCYKFIGVFLLLLLVIFLCAKEARSCARNQIREVILSYYSYCSKA